MGLLGVPVIGLVCSSLVLDETLGPALLIAAALIIFGIILGTTTPRKEHEQK
jgi:drug/metabolite transporter (DMT)-like permease